MTLKDVTNSIINISVGGYVNGEKFSKTRLYNYLNAMFRANDDPDFIRVEMPDGWWYTKVYKVHNLKGFYDYYLPDTREQEKELFDEFLERVSKCS